MPPNGLDAKTLFEGGEGITYNDFILLPGHIDFVLDSINLETNLTRNIKIKRPLVSSPMDTVTESRMAISMALLGGIGIIHYNNLKAFSVYRKRYPSKIPIHPRMLLTIRQSFPLSLQHGIVCRKYSCRI